MQGLHLTADLYGCSCSGELLIDARALAELCRRAVADAQLTVVDEKFFTFPDYEGQPGGVTGAVLLAESHLALHTWPERSGVTLDVYVCNFSTDNSDKAEQLMMDVHNKGKAVVSSGGREKAELDVFRLHEHGLWATMQQD